LAACSTVILLEQETNREIAKIATNEITILLMVKRDLRLKIKISKFFGVIVKSEVLYFVLIVFKNRTKGNLFK